MSPFKRQDKDSSASVPAAPAFSVTKWIRLFAPDLIMMALMGALGLGIYEACERGLPKLLLSRTHAALPS